MAHTTDEFLPGTMILTIEPILAAVAEYIAVKGLNDEDPDAMIYKLETALQQIYTTFVGDPYEGEVSIITPLCNAIKFPQHVIESKPEGLKDASIPAENFAQLIRNGILERQ